MMWGAGCSSGTLILGDDRGIKFPYNWGFGPHRRGAIRVRPSLGASAGLWNLGGRRESPPDPRGRGEDARVLTRTLDNAVGWLSRAVLRILPTTPATRVVAASASNHPVGERLTEVAKWRTRPGSPY